jgi:dienelactone hydrolase
MKKFSLASSFNSLPIEVFWYESLQPSTNTVILLKGIYGLHNPDIHDSWEMSLISACRGSYNFVCVNTARLGEVLPSDTPEAFTGKTFEQEWKDIQKGFDACVREGLISKEHRVIIVGNSFGGTLLLALPELLQKSEAVIMIGSGCGKSPTTIKPLLATMPSEEHLLSPLRSYGGTFVFVRGANDTVVPKESQDKIIASATSVRERLVCEIKDAAHNLMGGGVDRADMLSRLISYCTK